jgi:hypothetical protein
VVYIDYEYYVAGKANSWGKHAAGGAIYGNGQWCYLGNVIIDNSIELVGLEDNISFIGSGILYSTIDVSAIQTTLTNWANAQTATNENCIDKYSFEVTVKKDSFGYTDVTIKVLQNAPKYLLNIDMVATDGTSLSGQGVSATLQGDYVTYNGNIYATGDITLTANDTDDFAFTNWVVGGDNITDESITVNIVSVQTVSAVFKVNKVNVISKISFTYGSYYDTANSQNNQLSVVISSATPQAEGYIFIGWAKLSEGSLVFTLLDGQEDVYYAIWAVSNNATATFNVATSGSTYTPSATN